MDQEINYPSHEIRLGRTKAAIWANTKVGENGEKTVQHSVTLQRSYHDPATNEWKNQSLTLFPQEIPALMTVGRLAYEHCLVKETAGS